MAIVFPASPNLNEIFTEGSISYKCVGTDPIKWIGLGITPADRLVEGSNSLEINGSNNLVWTGNNVGIGTNNPQQLLDVASTAPNIRLTDTVDGHSEIDGNAAELKFNADKGNTKANSKITFFVDNSEKLRIDSSGRLLKSGQASLTSTSLNHPIQVAAESDANAIAIIGRAADDIGELSFYEADKSTKLGELQYRQDHLNLRHRVGDIRFSTGGTAERLRIDSLGKILIGPGAIANPKVTTIGAIDTSNSDWAIVMGGSGSGNRANDANKDGRFAGAHYTNAEEPIGLVRSYSIATANEVHFGGGSSIINAATQLSFYTAANTTTTGGTERLRIDSDGMLTHSGGHTNNSGGTNMGAGVYNRINAYDTVPASSNRTYTFTGLASGWMTIKGGGYSNAGQSQFAVAYQLGGYMTSANKFDVVTLQSWGSGATISVSKNAQSYDVIVTNNSGTYELQTWWCVEGNNSGIKVVANA